MRKNWTRYAWPMLLLAGTAALHGAAAMPETLAPQNTNEMQAALKAQPRPSHGARVFKQCAVCHGRDAGGSSDGVVPALASQHFRYLVKQIVEFRDDERFAGPVHDQVTREAMDGPQTIADLAAYLAELPPNLKPQTGSGRDVARGAQLYRAACESCHRDSALGTNELGVPSLRGQHYAYLVRQIGDIGDAHRFNTPADLVLLLKDMPPEDAEAIADYLSRLDIGAAIVTETQAPASMTATQARIAPAIRK